MKTKSLIAALLLAASSAFAQVPSYLPTNGLVGWWPFNGNANDESGNGYNGTVNGATSTADRFGNANKAYSFDGINDIINLPLNSGSLANSTVFTISYWIIPDTNKTTPQTVFANWLSYPTQIIGTKISFYTGYWGNGSGYNIFSGYFAGYGVGTNNRVSPIDANHVIIIFDGNEPISQNRQKVYLNGQLQNNNFSCINCQNNIPTSIGNMYNHTTIGGRYNTQQNNLIELFKGSIDDIGIWNRALSQQEITALYNSQSCSSNNIIPDGPTTFCAGNSVNLKSDVVGGTYQWRRNGVNISTNAISRTFKATLTGSYTCVATCNGTALTSNAIAVTSKTNASATVSAIGATSFCAGDSVTLNATNLGSNYSVQWYRTNVSMDNATNYSQVVKQPGTYKVVTKNLTNGCSRISGSSAIVAVSCRLANPDVIAADITESDFDAATREAEPKGKIYIYPNPTSDNKFTVELMGLEVDGNATLEVYNTMGQLLSSEKVNITNGSLNRTIHIDEQSKGQLCLVRLIVGSEIYDSKVILK